MKTILFILLLLTASKLYNAPCPEEDYPNIKYGPLESISFCLSEIGEGECENCCITFYFYKRWIAAQRYLDVMMDYVSPHQNESCYLCYRRYHSQIIAKAHKLILQQYASTYGLNTGQSHVHHLVMRAGCVRWVNEPYNFERVCTIEENSCCHKNYEVVINEYSQIVSYRASFGYRYYSNPPNCTSPCYAKCGLVANLNLFSSHPKNGDYINPTHENDINQYNYIVTRDDKITIHLLNDYIGYVNFEIFNELGSKISSTIFHKTIEINEHNINISNLSNGIYFLRILMNGEYKIFKLLKSSY